jgi:peptide/nickel transport system ATP-binding protein
MACATQPIPIRGELPMMDEQKLLEINGLNVHFSTDEGDITAVKDVSYHVKRGEVLGVVGESGCGKSVMAQAILRITPPAGKIMRGEILFSRGGGETVDLAKINPRGREIQQIRGRDIAMIFQEPMSSFSPLYTIGNQIMEAILLHQKIGKREARELAIEMLDRVGISDPAHRVDSFPFELSGGMRQRAMIAMAMSNKPLLLLADEPTTALDVTIQAQILDLMRGLQSETGTSIIFITHNLGVIAQMADRIAIMYLGKVVETGSVHEIFNHPQHPYTVNLLKAIPTIGKTSGRRLASIQGSIPGPQEWPVGCSFHPRCDMAMKGICDIREPGVYRLSDSQEVRCFLCEKGGGK